jgi:polar amino acid transport system substrate-binding protein
MRAAALAALAALALAAPARPDQPDMLFGHTLPPYLLERGQDGQGLEVEAARAALAVHGHTLTVRFVDRAQLAARLRAGQADAAQRGASDLSGPGIFYAAVPTVAYQDVAITLQGQHLAIYSVDDLRDKAVLAFEGARQFLGAEFNAAVRGNGHYAETADEQAKVAALYSGRTQVYVGDLNVFNYYRARLPGTGAPWTVHHIFARSELLTNNAVFRNARLRDDFEDGLRQLHTNGRYARLAARYLGAGGASAAPP